ncbi:chorismate mutase [Thiotrichales bacterium 19S9-12]|nr:chorismate mutase [Thiotrichales bacterium 19S9-11]MCF6811946.1 chorismate mutase [Thiotrichales bacterium 19S9-12]
MFICRGVRGATTIESNTKEAIEIATIELLEELVKRNQIDIDYLASVIFAVTPDITASFPPTAARKLGWHHVPLLNCQEMKADKGLPLCIRVLLHWNTDKDITEVKHIYLRGAAILRPDITQI